MCRNTAYENPSRLVKQLTPYGATSISDADSRRVRYLPDVFTEALRGNAQTRQMNLTPVQTLHATVPPTHAHAPVIRGVVNKFPDRVFRARTECSYHTSP